MSDMPYCPKCNGMVWDNRQTKKNPRQPDFKCKDKACDGVIWPPRPAKNTPSNAPGAPAQPAATLDPEVQKERLATLCQMHARITKYCAEHETPVMEKAKCGESPEAISARINTVFIQACQMGLHK